MKFIHKRRQQIIICRVFKLILALLGMWSAALPVCANSQQQEVVTTTPAYLDGVLYVASSQISPRGGHLRAVDLSSAYPTELWDAAEKVPSAGTNLIQADDVWAGNQSRMLLTNLSDQLVPLEAAQAERLLEALNVSTPEEAEKLLHAVRGRRGGTLESPAGIRESPQRLWAISRSSPVLVGRSAVVSAATRRHRVLYVGAEDGMLHAFLVSRWDESLGIYPLNDASGGTELWAYLPGSFLSFLQNQPFEGGNGESIIHLDGTPVVKELFVDLDGDGLRSWRTLLIGTGTITSSRRSNLFVLDVTDPYQPGLLWEALLPGAETGRTRGVNIGHCPDSVSECLYLATDYRATKNSAGLHVVAVRMQTGELLWQFSTTYAATGGLYSSTPAVPALMDLDQDHHDDTLVIGDLTGQLWALNLNDGTAYGGAPVYTVPANIEEPIGAAVSVYGNTVVFGTGGVAGSDQQQQYALYKVEISSEGGTLLWRFPLETGAKVWTPPLLDSLGNVIFTVAQNYDPLLNNIGQTYGRILVLNKDGGKVSEEAVDSAVVGQVVSLPGLVVTASLSGQVKQFGAASRLSGPVENSGSVRILSWRQR